jgi:hypothetical protein
MRLNFQKRSELKVVSRIIPEAERSERVSPKFQKRSELKVVSRIIPEAERSETMRLNLYIFSARISVILKSSTLMNIQLFNRK